MSKALCNFCGSKFHQSDMSFWQDQLVCDLCGCFLDLMTDVDAFVAEHGEGFAGFVTAGRCRADIERAMRLIKREIQP